MFKLEQIINLPPFSMRKQAKQKLYAESLTELSRLHYKGCPKYRKILALLNFDVTSAHTTEEMPFLPVRLFKDYELLSVPKPQIVKTMTSSGTTGQRVSRIFLDKENAVNQTRVLAKIMAHFLGKKRLPMLIIDTKAVVRDRNLFSARGAGILGFSMFGVDITYGLDENMQLDFDAMASFCKRHKGENILLFGFTYIVFKHFYKKLVELGKQLGLEKGIMIHGGGWKKLSEEAVDSDTFKHLLENVCGIKRVYNYYGMVEQTGSIFLECEYGRLHSSIFSDVLVRRHTDFSVCDFHEQGLIQLISLLPTSYPGHSILTEDLGEISGEDDCLCGRLGKYFKIDGRVMNAEIRGCSDTHEST